MLYNRRRSVVYKNIVHKMLSCCGKKPSFEKYLKRTIAHSLCCAMLYSVYVEYIMHKMYIENTNKKCVFVKCNKRVNLSSVTSKSLRTDAVYTNILYSVYKKRLKLPLICHLIFNHPEYTALLSTEYEISLHQTTSSRFETFQEDIYNFLYSHRLQWIVELIWIRYYFLLLLLLKCVTKAKHYAARLFVAKSIEIMLRLCE